jgi:acetoin utilization deacetylase AcuC-like enzyme
MFLIVSADQALHNPPHEVLYGALVPIYESPVRAEMIQTALEQANIGTIIEPRRFGIEPIRAVHSDDYLEYLEHSYERWVAAGGSPEAVLPETLAVRWMGPRTSTNPIAQAGYYAFDMSAPIVAGTYRAARSAADAALTGAALLREGQRFAYALCRPPGHHAGRDLCGGYCFLNNAAIAAEDLLRNTPNTSRVAIIDIDYHHGNGTQQIFYERDDVLFVSIHADPVREYPYFTGFADERGASAGLGTTLNIPLAAGVDDRTYLDALDVALAAIRSFEPQFVVVSAGFDTFGGDPLGDFALSAAAYPQIGRRIAALGLPTLVLQEGGYAVEALGTNVVGLLRGLESSEE